MKQEATDNKIHSRQGLMSLSPLLVFIVLYLVTSIIAQDFYKVPVTVAFLISAIYAVATTKGTLNKRVETFSKGAGNSNMMLMMWIFLLAGAFASSAKSMGAVDATVNLTLHILPDELLLPGIFLASCFISLAIGTSVGTIAALTPVAAGISAEAGVDLPFMTAIVVGGAYFGDNLSFISDTTIIATQTQGCKMSDKFKVNSRLVIPGAIIVMIAYFLMGKGVEIPDNLPEIEFVKVIPYIMVLVSAILGANVMVVLAAGLLLTGCIGMFYGQYDIYGWFSAMSDGMQGMSELIIMTLLAAGMLAMIKFNGGINYLISKLTRSIADKRSAEFSIALLVCLVNICTANNTVAIITTGPIARDIAEKYGVDKRKSASILDTASCFTQGILPYGAQMLIAAGLAGISPVSIMPYLYYPLAMGLTVIVAILFRLPKKYS